MNILMYKTKQDVIESILTKLDQRVKSAKEFRISINDISSIEELRNLKKPLNKQFFELEDDVRQSIQIIKALLIQNKDLSEQLEESDTFTQNEDKIRNEYSIDNNRINSIVKENQKLQQDINKNEMILIDLNEKISLLSNQLRVKNMELKKNEEFLLEYEKNNFDLIQENKMLREEIYSIVNNKKSEDINSNRQLTENKQISVINNNNDSNRNFKTVQSERNYYENINNFNSNENNYKLKTNYNYSDAVKIKSSSKKDITKMNNEYGNIQNNNHKKGNSEKSEKHSNTGESTNEKMNNEKELFNNMVNEYLKSNQNEKRTNLENEDSKNNEIIKKFKNEEAINNNKSEFNENITYGDNSKLIDKNESKIGKVTNLVLKINNSGKIFKHCAERFGKDFLDNLLNPETSGDIIEPLEEFIFELENSTYNSKVQNKNKANYSINKSGHYENYSPHDLQNDEFTHQINTEDNNNVYSHQQNKYKNQYSNPINEIKEEDEEILKLQPVNNNLQSPSQMNTKGILSTNQSKYSSSNYSNIMTSNNNNYDLNNNQEIKGQLRKINSNTVQNKKLFNNYTKPYGHYFDPKYQFGGVSKLEENNLGRMRDSNSNFNNSSKSKSIPKHNNTISNSEQSRIDFEQHKKVAEYKETGWNSTKEFFLNDSTPNYAMKSPDKVNNCAIYKINNN